MPLIESKHDGRQESISMKTYNKMVELGIIRRWKVINTDDIAPTVQPRPVEIMDFLDEQKKGPVKIEGIYTREELEEFTKDELADKFNIDKNQLKSEMINEILN